MLLNQLLKKFSVDWVVKLKKAKGEIISKTSIRIYLYAKLMSNVIEEIESIPLRIPSTVKISKLEVPLFNKETKLLNEIGYLKTSCPNPQKKELM